MTSILRMIRRAAFAYAVIGLLTWADWHFVWLKDDKMPPPWDRATVSMTFGPFIALSWPWQWMAFYELGTWSWMPPTPDQLYGCTIEQRAPNGECQ